MVTVSVTKSEQNVVITDFPVLIPASMPFHTLNFKEICSPLVAVGEQKRFHSTRFNVITVSFHFVFLCVFDRLIVYVNT